MKYQYKHSVISTVTTIVDVQSFNENSYISCRKHEVTRDFEIDGVRENFLWTWQTIKMSDMIIWKVFSRRLFLRKRAYE